MFLNNFENELLEKVSERVKKLNYVDVTKKRCDMSCAEKFEYDLLMLNLKIMEALIAKKNRKGRLDIY